MDAQRRRRVGSDRHEAGVPDRELAREAVHELEAHGGDDRDSDPRGDREVVGIQQARQPDVEGDEGGGRQRDRGDAAPVH
jgi:hypothetical protein